MIDRSLLIHKGSIYSRDFVQGFDGEPVFSYTRKIAFRCLAVPKAGRIEQDPVEIRPQTFLVYTDFSREIRAGLWIKVEVVSPTGATTLLTGQIRQVDNPNFANDHLELQVEDGGDPISG